MIGANQNIFSSPGAIEGPSMTRPSAMPYGDVSYLSAKPFMVLDFACQIFSEKKRSKC